MYAGTEDLFLLRKLPNTQIQVLNVRELLLSK